MKNIRKIYNNLKNTEAYLKINLILAGIIIAVIIYSGIFSAQNEHPIKCVHFEQTGIKCETCGISRSFSEIVRFNFTEAKNFNRNGIPVFLFFLIQLGLRLLFLLIFAKKWTKQSNIIIIDSLVSTTLFIFFFKNLIF